MTGRVLLSLGQREGAIQACELATLRAQELKVTEHELAAAVLRLELSALDGATPDLIASATELFARTDSSGFAYLARRCSAVIEAAGSNDTDIIEQVAKWRLSHIWPWARRDTSTEPAGRPESLLDELKRLDLVRPAGKWTECRLIRDRIWESDGIPSFLIEASTQVCGCSFVQLNERFQMPDTSAASNDGASSDSANSPLLRWAHEQLGRNEEDQRALEVLSKQWAGRLDPATVYQLCATGCVYSPRNVKIRSVLIDSARQAGKLEDCITVLGNIAAFPVDSASIYWQIANCFRELGRYGYAAITCDQGHRACMLTRWSGGRFYERPESLYAAYVVGLGFDLICDGHPAEAAVKAIRTGFYGFPMIQRYGPEAPLSAPALKTVGSEYDQRGYRSAVDLGGNMYENLMYSLAQPYPEDSPRMIVARIIEHAVSDDKKASLTGVTPRSSGLLPALMLLLPLVLDPAPGHTTPAAQVRIEIGRILAIVDGADDSSRV
jgi:hypothetical protein